MGESVFIAICIPVIRFLLSEHDYNVSFSIVSHFSGIIIPLLRVFDAYEQLETFSDLFNDICILINFVCDKIVHYCGKKVETII